MIDLRALVRLTLIDDGEFQAVFDDRVFQFGSIDDQPERPYVVVKFSVSSPEWRRGPQRRNFQVWFQDDPGDYSKIDFGLERAKDLLVVVSNQEDLIEVNHLDFSQDLEDPALGTICRYARFQAATAA